MKTFKKIVPLLFILPMCFAQFAKANEGNPRVIKVEATDQMRFSVTDIEARPGETIKLELTVNSNLPKAAMSHNIVLLKAEADATAFAAAAARASDNDYIPPKMTDQVVAYSPLAGGGETVEVTITVPEKTGEYQYICSFPGHFAAGMKGTLKVTNNPS